MASSILQIKSPVTQDENIIGQQFHTYSPYTSSFNHNDEIRIAIQSQDLYVLPSESYLYIEFSAAIPTVGEADAIYQFCSHYAPHLFSELRYELNGFEIDRCKTPGITTLMKNMCATKLDDKNILDLIEYNGNANVTKGSYRLVLPLRFFFGFCEDYTKILLHSKHELILLRSRSDENVFISTDKVPTLTVTKIQWKMPHVTLSDQSKLLLLKTLDRDDDIKLAYRSWDLYELPALPETDRHSWTVKTTTQVAKPRYIIVGFQTNRNFVLTNDPAKFDHCNITDVKIYLNNQRYPYDNLHTDFSEKNYQELSLMLLNIQKSYYNNNGGCNPLDYTYNQFLERPLFAFDCSRTDESIKQGMVDVRIEINSSKSLPAKTTAYCLIIHDNLVHYSPLTGMVHREI